LDIPKRIIVSPSFFYPLTVPLRWTDMVERLPHPVSFFARCRDIPTAGMMR